MVAAKVSIVITEANFIIIHKHGDNSGVNFIRNLKMRWRDRPAPIEPNDVVVAAGSPAHGATHEAAGGRYSASCARGLYLAAVPGNSYLDAIMAQ